MKRVLIVLLLIATSLPGVWGDGLLDAALKDYQTGNYLGALEGFQKVLQEGGAVQADEALLGQAKTFFALLDYDNAGKSLTTLMTRYPHSPFISSAMYWKARVALAQHDPQNALLLFDGYLKTQPKGRKVPESLFWMGEAASELGQNEAAENILRQLIYSYPTSGRVEAARYRLEVLGLDQNIQKLLDLLRWSNAESLNAAAEYQRREREFEQALLLYQKKLLNGPGGDAMARILSLQKEIADKDATILSLKAQLAGGRVQGNSDAAAKLVQLKLQALELKDFFLEWRLNHEKS
ncbi:MAG: tetratricopeptide repeat protein [Spirochaetales bacterium]|nr:tetratricopeptide repeat protein [Spirochaetales bacterium]